ncbi:MAG: DUF2892 domain-containing protein [Bacillota bacterium]|jgi:hypothetical protein
MALSFKRNVGMPDRITRNTLGILILAAGIFGDMAPVWAATFVMFGIYLLVVVVTGYDPLYDILGISTREHHLFEEEE